MENEWEKSFRNRKVRYLQARVAGVPDLQGYIHGKKDGFGVVLSNLKNSKEGAVTENGVNRQGKPALGIVEVTNSEDWGRQQNMS